MTQFERSNAVRPKSVGRGSVARSSMVLPSHLARFRSESPVVVNTTTGMTRSAVRNELAAQGLTSLGEVYCGHCHFATPRWRKRCIHCTQLMA